MPEGFDLWAKNFDEAIKFMESGEIRGKSVWSMASHFTQDAQERHKYPESIQGVNGIYHCADYMFASSMSTAMAYATILSTKIADKINNI